MLYITITIVTINIRTIFSIIIVSFFYYNHNVHLNHVIRLFINIISSNNVIVVVIETNTGGGICCCSLFLSLFSLLLLLLLLYELELQWDKLLTPTGDRHALIWSTISIVHVTLGDVLFMALTRHLIAISVVQIVTTSVAHISATNDRQTSTQSHVTLQ